MFGLAQKIGRADFPIHGFIGDDQRLRGAREKINADAAIKLALGFRDKGIAGADQHIHGRNAFRTQRHGTHRLNAAQAIDLIRAGQMLRRHNGRGRPAFKWWRAGDDALAARDLGRDYRHMSRCQQRVFAARHIAADGIDRDIAVAEHHAGQGFHLNIAQSRFLMFGEIAHLGLRKADIFQVARRELIKAGLDFAFTQAEILPVPFVEADGKLPHCGIAARLDIGQNALNRRAHLGVIFRHRIRIPAPLEETRHVLPLF